MESLWPRNDCKNIKTSKFQENEKKKNKSVVPNRKFPSQNALFARTKNFPPRMHCLYELKISFQNASNPKSEQGAIECGPEASLEK